jgi:hypothetical protein
MIFVRFASRIELCLRVPTVHFWNIVPDWYCVVRLERSPQTPLTRGLSSQNQLRMDASIASRPANNFKPGIPHPETLDSNADLHEKSRNLIALF